MILSGHYKYHIVQLEYVCMEPYLLLKMYESGFYYNMLFSCDLLLKRTSRYYCSYIDNHHHTYDLYIHGRSG